MFDQSRFAIRRHIATADKNWVTVVTSAIGSGLAGSGKGARSPRKRELSAYPARAVTGLTALLYRHFGWVFGLDRALAAGFSDSDHSEANDFNGLLSARLSETLNRHQQNISRMEP